jgi:hypothetical protein
MVLGEQAWAYLVRFTDVEGQNEAMESRIKSIETLKSTQFGTRIDLVSQPQVGRST